MEFNFLRYCCVVFKVKNYLVIISDNLFLINEVESLKTSHETSYMKITVKLLHMIFLPIICELQ